MRKHLVWVLGLALAVAVAAVAVGANTQSIIAKVGPAKQDKNRYGAASINVTTETGSDDGSTIAPATRAQIFFDDDLVFNTRGLATCTKAQLENTTPAQAKAKCRRAQVGAGKAEAAVGGNPNTPRVGVEVTAFNGTPRGNKPVLLLHSFTAAIGQTIVLEGVLKNTSGDFGKVLDVNVPLLAANSALTKFQTKVQKSFRFQGRTRHYVTARCHDRNRQWNFKGTFTYQGAPSKTATTTQSCQVR
jgi:hypothetical protein